MPTPGTVRRTTCDDPKGQVTDIESQEHGLVRIKFPRAADQHAIRAEVHRVSRSTEARSNKPDDDGLRSFEPFVRLATCAAALSDGKILDATGVLLTAGREDYHHSAGLSAVAAVLGAKKRRGLSAHYYFEPTQRTVFVFDRNEDIEFNSWLG